jgi:predicted transcriptional regulator YheO
MFTSHINIAKSIIQLMQPLVEVVIHDLKTQTITYIEGGLSKRKIGDPSLLDEIDNWNNEVDDVVYHKLSHDGRLLKSVTIPIQNNSETMALMCINYDVSVFQEMQKIATLALTKRLDEQPQSLFKNDWQERIHIALHKILSEKGKKIDKLTFDEKKEIVQFLYQMGAFKGRNATDYIAEILNLGRATIFKYLKQTKSIQNVD